MPDSLTLSGTAIERLCVRSGVTTVSVRGPEWVMLCFLIYSAVAAELLPIASNTVHRVILLNLIILLLTGLVIFLDRGGRALAPGIVRDWLPLAALEFAYQEMGWFVMPYPEHALEAKWVAWDRLFLHGGVRAAVEVLGPALPSLLEICYSLAYALAPICLTVLYLYRRRSRVDRFLLVFLTGVLLCYGQFPFWPSEPPRALYLSQDLPSFDTIFRHFNLWLLGNCGIHTSVFPSAHVAGAFSAAFGMRMALPERKWVSRALFGTAVLIALATVYGRYHYLTDAAAGLAMALVAAGMARLWGGRAPRVPQTASNTNAGARWCFFMHDSPMWPIHGYYRCRTCGRRFPVP